MFTRISLQPFLSIVRFLLIVSLIKVVVLNNGHIMVLVVEELEQH